MEVTNLSRFDKAFENLSTVSGFLIAGIYNSQGEVLAATSSSRFNFHEVGGFAIELYRGAKGITDKMGLGTCNFVETHTDNFIYIHFKRKNFTTTSAFNKHSGTRISVLPLYENVR